MDVELLSKMIGQLLSDHNSVALPGIGTFVAVEMGASFSDRGFTINPPYRQLSFVQGRADDTLLADLYARSNGIDVESAKAVISNFLRELGLVLKDRKAIYFPGLGLLRATSGNALFFVPDEDIDIYPEGFALSKISLKNTRPEASDAAESEIVVPSSVPDAAESEVAVLPDGPSPIFSGPPTAAATSDQNQKKKKKKKKKFRWWMAVPAAIALAALLLAAFLLLAHIAPDFIDSLLYTPEELRIINASL